MGRQLLEQPLWAILLLSKWATNTLFTRVLPYSCDKQMFNLFHEMSLLFFALPPMKTPSKASSCPAGEDARSLQGFRRALAPLPGAGPHLQWQRHSSVHAWCRGWVLLNSALLSINIVYS